MEFHWTIEDLICKVSGGDVYRIHYSLETYADGYVVTKRDTIDVSGSASDPNFIKFADLDHDTVLGWITGSLPVEEMKTELSSSFALLANGTYIKGVPDNFYD